MWTEERVATLRKAWLEGLSARQIATQLGGVTRNAVIGKAHRLGLSGAVPHTPPPRRVRPARPARPRLRRPDRPQPPPSAPVARRAILPEGPGLITCLTALRGPVCKWPIGDPRKPGFSFCGARTAGDGPYCPDHRQVAYRPLKLKPLARDPYVRRVLAGRAA